MINKVTKFIIFHVTNAHAYGERTINKKLIYRKQIARQCAQNTSTASNSVTVKCRLRVTKGHWKRNHWIYHIRLTSLLLELFDVEYYRDLKMRVKGHSRSWNIVLFESLGTVSYSDSRSNYGRMFSRFGDIQHQRMA